MLRVSVMYPSGEGKKLDSRIGGLGLWRLEVGISGIIHS